MPRNDLPTYAIVELLIRLSDHNFTIGDYKDHTVSDDEVVVKTTAGIIRFPESLIMQQFEAPELITSHQLTSTVSSFRAYK